MSNMQLKNEELKVICAEDCGNAPKKKLIKEFNIAFANYDIGFISENISGEICWNLVGEQLVIQGKDVLAATLEQMKNKKIIELQITSIITHGNTGAANGVIKYENAKTFAFCNVYIFSSAAKNAKIKDITSYVIEVPSS
ncbi:nuclear transport factor 2 family protein [Paenibacillus sp. PL91]|uniref:nuclear transport factor 2 family protein n=1 Tax=Paenibacillus sp. PL91 TaxID=2729538 RepID=UPI001659E126|nr:nuclear transport factor 2 family protein [Paenibacillus sp. PL91]MBC9198916.1 nuclear transport factor 2 family protein [Paenibacillus sp. PL91]